MKRSLIIALLAACFTTLCAQPTLTSANRPMVGDTSVFQFLTTAPSPGPSGAGVSWDFSSEPYSGETVFTYVHPTSAPGSALFPDANIAATVPGSNDYSYFHFNGNYLLNLGYTNSSSALVYSNYFEDIAFPMTFGDSENIDFTGADTVSPSPVFTTNGTGTIEADAYGTLTQPNGNVHTNVLRLKIIIEGTENTAGGANYIVKQTSYVWFSPDYRDNLMRIDYATYTNAVDSFYFSSSNFNSPTNAGPTAITSLASEESNIIVHPNPTSEQLNISWNAKEQGNGFVTITTMDGKLLSQESIGIQQGQNTHTVDVSNIPAGIYIISLGDENSQTNNYLVVE